MFKTRKFGFGLALALGLMVTAPVMADEACQKFIADVDKATATVNQLQKLRDDIAKYQADAAASSGEVAAEPYKCPACGMMMPTSPKGNMTKAVKYGGKTYYCCKGCDMSATADK